MVQETLKIYKYIFLNNFVNSSGETYLSKTSTVSTKKVVKFIKIKFCYQKNKFTVKVMITEKGAEKKYFSSTNFYTFLNLISFMLTNFITFVVFFVDAVKLIFFLNTVE